VKESPVYLAGAFDLAAAMIEGEGKVEQAFRDGSGVRWGESAGCLFCSVGAFFRPTYINNIVQSWLPALDGVHTKLLAGAKVADIGCGRGTSSGWSMFALLASAVSTWVIASAYGRDAATRSCAFAMRLVATSSCALVIFLVDLTERIRRRST